MNTTQIILPGNKTMNGAGLPAELLKTLHTLGVIKIIDNKK